MLPSVIDALALSRDRRHREPGTDRWKEGCALSYVG